MNTYIVEIGRRGEVAQETIQISATTPVHAMSEAFRQRPEWESRLVINTTLQIRIGTHPK